jgi:hypothetical protein
MKYLLMVCGGAGREQSVARMSIEEWVSDTDGRGVRLLGRALDPPQSAVTVRVRDGETLLTDGPFIESKEFIAGFDVVDCGDLAEAVEVAANHPMAAVGAIEVRPFRDGLEVSPEARAWGASEPTDSWVLFMCLDGVPEPDEVEAEIAAGCRAWPEPFEQQGVYVLGHPVEHPDAAKTVRIVGEDALVSDGPFAETKEFLGGFAVLSGVTREQAIAAAAAHPLAHYHRVEVRRFMD